jgi:nitrate reductase gamma subunit
MAQMIDFFMRPFFAFSAALMILGLVRLFIITVIDMRNAFRNAGDKDIKFFKVIKETAAWLLPGKNTVRTAAVFSIISIIFHIGLIIVPVFLFEHIIIWKHVFKFGWPAIGKETADIMTLITIICGLTLLGYRLFSGTRRNLSQARDYAFLILILFIFTSGYMITGSDSFLSFETRMLIHIICGDIAMIIFPFTRLSHCILYPVLRLASAIAWHFPRNSSKELNKLLYGEENKRYNS